MSTYSRVTVGWPVLALAALVLLAVGAGVGYVALQPSAPAGPSAGHEAMTPATPPPAAGRAAEAASSTGAATFPDAASSEALSAVASPQPVPPELAPSEQTAPDVAPPDVVVRLSRESAERAGITTVLVQAGTASGALRAPGIVEANAYKRVVVTPLVGGRVTRVAAELGQQVRQGETLAEIFSPELAEWQARYISARAELAAHERELARTEKLAEIGAASRQELERIHAGHTTRLADIQSAASRLQLLGLSPEAIDGLGSRQIQGPTANVLAPLAGVVIERAANVGLNVDQATILFTVADLSSVWVVASVHERDLARVRVGSPATVKTPVYQDLALHGRVSYIDPQVNAETRTARLRVGVPNRRSQLRLGMYADVLIGQDTVASTSMVPRSAVQNIGGRTVVYVAHLSEPGTFIERQVRLGAVSGDRVAVLAGVRVGDRVVAEGSFSVRAERDRLGLRATGPMR